MKAKIFTTLIFALLPLLSFAKTITVFPVFNNIAEVHEARFYAKSGNNYEALKGSYGSIGEKGISINCEETLEIFTKNGDDYVPAGTVNVPENAKKCGLIILPQNKRHEFAAHLFEIDQSKLAAGTLYLLNLTQKSLRGTIDGKDLKIIVPANEQAKYFTVPTGTGVDATIRLVSAAKSKEEAKRTWRYGNNLHLAPSEAYLLVVAGTGSQTENGRDINEVLIFRWSKKK